MEGTPISGQPAEGEGGRPVLRVISSNATPEEIAAVVAVLSAVSGGGGEARTPPATRSLWSDSTRAPGHRLAPGPGSWRASALPH